jgi:hypothetical protein
MEFISDEDIARYFGYKNVRSFQNSTANKRIREGIKQLLERVGAELPKTVKWNKK